MTQEEHDGFNWIKAKLKREERSGHIYHFELHSHEQQTNMWMKSYEESQHTVNICWWSLIRNVKCRWTILIQANKHLELSGLS